VLPLVLPPQPLGLLGRVFVFVVLSWFLLLLLKITVNQQDHERFKKRRSKVE
jgi:hypothetical protein